MHIETSGYTAHDLSLPKPRKKKKGALLTEWLHCSQEKFGLKLSHTKFALTNYSSILEPVLQWEQLFIRNNLLGKDKKQSNNI